MRAVLTLEEAKIGNDIQLARRRGRGSGGKKRKRKKPRRKSYWPPNGSQALKERAIAERETEIARLNQQKEIEIEDARVKSEVDTLLARARAKASAASEEASAEKARMEAKAAGRAALYSAENTLSDAVIRMRLEERKL